jgi:hypothetical protein
MWHDDGNNVVRVNAQPSGQKRLALLRVIAIGNALSAGASAGITEKQSAACDRRA